MPSTSPVLARRREREQAILAATRRLFDESGVRDAQIDEIAKAVGVNRAIIYRHFSGKEELFALTLVSYLDELAERLRAAAARKRAPLPKLTAIVEAFVDYGVEYPAFVDCAQTLMRRPGPDLLEEVSEGSLFQLGRGIAKCLKVLSETLDEGIESGAFSTTDTNLLANHMYATGLGALQLARVGMIVHEAAPGVPAISPITPDQVKEHLVASARALAR